MQQQSVSKRMWVVAILAIAGACFCALVPWFYYGIPSGHDFEFHFNSWIEILNHWKQGIVYPHWAAWAHYGYGEARFVFYPPVSWTLGGILSALLPWKVVPGAFVWLALTAAGCSMFVAAKQWLSPTNALFTALLYALNPYHLIIVYWRSALAELICAIYLPLLLRCIVQLPAKGRRVIVPIALLLAAGWLTNVPGAVMMHYLFGLLVLWIAFSRRKWDVFALAALAVIAGAALAAVYLLPVWHQRAWVSLDQVLSPGVRPQENFLFAHTTDVEHDKFNLVISVLAVSEFALTAFVLTVWRGKRLAQLWRPILAVGLASTLFMLPFTFLLWKHLPELRYVQFPWRWLLVFNLVMTLAVAVGVQRWWARIVLCLLLLAPVLVGAPRILAPYWDNTGDLWEMVDNQHDQVGYEGVDEYAPAGVDPSDLDQNAPLAKFEGSGPSKITVQRWDAEHRVVAADVTSAGILALRLFDYPLWKIKVNGLITKPGSGPHGEIVVPLSPGENRVEAKFGKGWDQKMGAAISLVSLLAILVFRFYRKD